MLVLRDERLREAYSSDEIELFRGVAAIASAITMQNSQVYERMKERDRLAALGEMAAGLAHEIRNPLGAIKGAAQYLQPGPATSRTTREGTQEFLDIIVEEVNRLNNVVSQFLDYARPYRGDQRQLDVNDVVRKTLQLLEKEAEEHGRVEIAADFAERLPPVRADPEQLLPGVPEPGDERAAGDARRRQARILDQRCGAPTRRGPRRRSWRSGSATPASASRRATCKNLFIPFYTTKQKGTGLGLPISQRIIEHHGGTIEVRSQPGEGATFTVLLPIEADAYASTRRRCKRPRRSPSRDGADRRCRRPRRDACRRPTRASDATPQPARATPADAADD